jgi:pimeloyl-ACP methyl ester carboxylesterase
MSDDAGAGRTTDPTVEDVTVGGLSGTLLRPTLDRPPAVLLIAGSGPTDRDGRSRSVGAPYLKNLAEGLAARGIASLRYDKRGVGRSASVAPAEKDLRFDHYVADAEQWLAWLRGRGDQDSVAVAGHSEGALIATHVSLRTPAGPLILLAPPGRTFGAVLRDQLRATAMPPALLDEALVTLSALERGESAPSVNPALFALFRPSVQPYLRSMIAIDPARELSAVRNRVLIVSGGRDLQITSDDIAALVRARPDAAQYHRAIMNHVLADAPDDREGNVLLYADSATALASGLVDAVAAFIARGPD